jgi:hypothetical protein
MDPTEYTPADAYAERIATDLPDLSEVSAAALAFIRAIRKLEKASDLVTGIEPITEIADWLALDITEAVDLDEDDRYPFCIRTELSGRVEAERRSWLRAIDQDLVDDMLAGKTINLAGMVVDILGAKK